LKGFDYGGVIKDEAVDIEYSASNELVILRLVTCKDALTKKILRFISNQFSYEPETIAQLYRCRWAIEPFFKQIKQNFEVGYFFSDSKNGIETQIWITLIANLLFTIIHQRIKEAEQFTTLVAITRTSMGSFVCLITLLKRTRLNKIDRNNEIVQLQIFETVMGGVFKTVEPNPLYSP